MNTRLLDLAELTNHELDAWRTLATSVAEPNPFFEIELLVPALTHLDPLRAVKLVTMWEGPRLCALFPVRYEPRWRRLPATAMVTWLHDYCYLGTPLVAADSLEPFAQALHAHLRSGPAAFAVLPWVNADGPVADALEHLRPLPSAFDGFERALLERRDDGDYRSALGRETTRRLAQRRRALERDLGTVRVVDHADDAGAQEDFLALEAGGWKGTEGTAMASDPAHAEFFRDMAGQFAKAGRLQLRSLRAGDETAAMSMRLVAEPGTFCFKIAYDERYKKYAPGLQLELETLDSWSSAKAGVEWVDACTAPGNTFFEALFPQRRRLRTLVVPGRNAAYAIMLKMLSFAHHRRHKVRGTE